jgi:hypothetical protein
MADYTTLDQVRAMLPDDIDLDNIDRPYATDVSVWITNDSERYDVAVAAGGGTVPVTGNDLGDANMLITRDAVYQIMAVRGAAGKSATETVWDRWHQEFEAKLLLLSSPETSTATSTASNPSGGVVVDPWFTRDMVF